MGCTSPPDPASIAFYSLPEVSFTPVFSIGTIPLKVNFTNTSSSDVTSFHWYFGNNDAASGLTNPSYTFSDTGSYIIILTGINANSCVDTAQGIVLVEFEIPNVFTPNGDGKNDIFMFPYYSVTDFNAVIYNRWGRKVYEWNNPAEGWDGGDSKDGTYYYVMRAIGLDGNNIDKSGHVTLLR